MVSIEIGNSYSKINGLASGPFNKLRKLLSYSPDAQTAYFSGGYAKLRYCIDKQGNFPTGLLPRVDKFVRCDMRMDYAQFDIRLVPKPKVDHRPSFKGPHSYKWQREACLYAGKHHRAIISAPTGSGKSFAIALIVERLGVKTLIVVPSLPIKEQLTELFEGYFGTMQYITIENIDSNALKSSTDYDLLIIDEAHHVAAKTYQKLNKTAWKGIYYRVFLTATPFRNQTEETLLFEGIAGSDIYKLSYKEAVAAGYIVPVEAYYIEMPKTETDAYTWAQVYSELVVNNEYRNQCLFLLTNNLFLADKSVLTLVKEIKHGEILSEGGLAFANGQDEDTRKYIDWFNQRKLKCLIGTTGLIGEGVDTKPCEYVIIAGLGKAKSAFMQQVGRCVRTYPGKESGKVILIKDNSHKFTKSHFKAQCKILLDEYGVIPVKLEI